MLVVLEQDYEDVSREAARIVAHAVRSRPSVVLGLATGATMLGLYRELARMHREQGLDFSRVATFNLDEYVGLNDDHPQSFHYFMRHRFFDHVNIPAANIHIPEGTKRGDFEAYCASYEESIRRAGGIDLQILGVGRDGHVGFNEPSSSLGSRTRLKTLSKETLEDNRRFFSPDEEMPQCAITMGIGTIMEARRVLILASGSAKARSVVKAIEGPVTAAVTSSALQLHPDVTFVVDEDAASELHHKEYYRRAMDITARLTPNRLW
jgi:glucosamine-6-phosphate deaminase